VHTYLAGLAALSGTRINGTDDGGAMLWIAIVAGSVLAAVLVGLLWRWSDHRRGRR